MKALSFVLGALALGLVACSSQPAAQQDASAESKGGDAPVPAKQVTGKIRIDGSSTVFPITSAVAEEFRKVQPGVDIAVGYSGTGGGFKKFDLGETDINNASRPIKESEAKSAAEHKIEFIELPVAYDGLTIVLNPKNDWVDFLTVAELKKIWEPSSAVKKWNDVRSTWPDKEIKLYGPGTDSGTFDYFTEAINGKSGASRPDYTATEDDNLIVQGVAGDLYAMGYFGVAYFEENKKTLKAAPIKADDKAPAVLPTHDDIMNAKYVPLSRPLFIYVTKAAADRPEVDAFLEYYLNEGTKLVGEVGYIALPPRAYELSLDRFRKRTVGSVFLGGHNNVGVSVESLLTREGAGATPAAGETKK